MSCNGFFRDRIPFHQRLHLASDNNSAAETPNPLASFLMVSSVKLRAPLKARNIGAMQIGTFSQFHLRDSKGGPELPYGRSKAPDDS